MENFTPFASLAGGVLIGSSATLMLWATGRIAGVSGILGGLLAAKPGDAVWRLWFVAGMASAGALSYAVAPAAFTVAIDRSATALIFAGLLVGFGTRLGSGCTSGHGVCGMSRLSPRSIVATLVFMATGAATVFAVGHLLGGRL